MLLLNKFTRVLKESRIFGFELFTDFKNHAIKDDFRMRVAEIKVFKREGKEQRKFFLAFVQNPPFPIRKIKILLFGCISIRMKLLKIIDKLVRREVFYLTK